MRRLILLLLILIFLPIQASAQNRPQEPKEPFNYISEEVVFTNTEANSIKLSGTLTLPKNVKKPPVAILISGSGAQNRNAEFFGHKWFLVLSDYLTSNGIAVLRYDERGIEKSEGDFSTATTFDLASDAEAAVAYLKTRKDVSSKKIGIIGHSEGGVIAPIVASRNKAVAFVVLLAGPGISGDETLRLQNEILLPKTGLSKEFIDIQLDINNNIYEIVKNEKNNDSLTPRLSSFLDDYMVKNKEKTILPFILNEKSKKQFLVYSTPWIREFIRLDPEPYLSKTTCPVLALNGNKDLQVIADINLNGIKEDLIKTGNKDVTIKELEGLNHLFQKAETGMGNEYTTIETTIEPEVLVLIKDWILKRF